MSEPLSALTLKNVPSLGQFWEQEPMNTLPSVTASGEKTLQGVLYTLQGPGGVPCHHHLHGPQECFSARNSFPSHSPCPTPAFLLLRQTTYTSILVLGRASRVTHSNSGTGKCHAVFRVCFSNDIISSLTAGDHAP